MPNEKSHEETDAAEKAAADEAKDPQHQFKELDPARETVLVLEDSLPNRNILSAILSKLNFQVLIAENGNIGRGLLETCVEKKVNLVLVLTDIMMPEVDGFEFIGILRACTAYAKIPALFITALADKDYVVEAGKVHASGYLLKPVSMQQIRDKLKSLFPGHDFTIARRNKTAA